MSFAYWSRYQFNNALSDLQTTITANTLLVSSPLEKDTDLASTSSEISEALASSSEETILEITTASTSSPQATPPVTATSIDLEPSFTFPQKGGRVYIGCTYPVSWQSSAKINSLGTVLVDAGARKSIDPTASGLAKESVIETDSQNLNWKVGMVWPGEYYIKVSNINGVDLETRSEVFTISRIPKGTSADEREKICKESDGSF